MKTTEFPIASAPDGSEEILINQGTGANAKTKRMPASAFASAGTRPTPDELKSAILSALVSGTNITFTQNADGTVGVGIVDSADLAGTPKAPTAAPGTNTRQIATTAFVKAAADALTALINGKQGALHEGAGIDIVDNGDGTFTISSTGSGGGTLVDGTYGDVVVSGGGTVLSVKSATNATITVPDEAYAPAWSGKMGVPTKNALYNKLEGLNAAINGRVANSAVGVANGVASLDSGGKVPAAQLPSYVDDVLEFTSASTFPNPGESGKIYVALDTNLQWRWGGSGYTQIVSSPGSTDNVPEGGNNKYYTDVRVRAAVMTGLGDVVGAPAATDALLAVLGKLSRQAFTVLGPIAGGTFGVSTLWLNTNKSVWQHDGSNGFLRAQIGGLYLGAAATTTLALLPNGNIQLPTNQQALQFTDANGFHPYFICQGDNNFVLYSTDANGNARAVFSVGTHSNTAPLVLSLPTLCQSDLTVNGQLTYASDRRIKTDIRPYDGRESVLALEAKRFVKDGREQIGFIAQEVEAVIPEAVRTASKEDGGLKSLDLAPVVAGLVEQVKHLTAELERLKAA